MWMLDVCKITCIKRLGNVPKNGIFYHWCFGTTHWDFSLGAERCHADPADLLRRWESRWEGWYGEWGEWLGWQWSRGGRESVKTHALGGVCPSVALGALLQREKKVLYPNTIFWEVSFQSVCGWSYEPQWADSSLWGCRISAPVWWTPSGDPDTFFSPHPALPSELHSPESQPDAHTLHTHRGGERGWLRRKVRERRKKEGRGGVTSEILQTMMQAKWELAFLCFFLFKQARREILFLVAKNVFFSLQGFHFLTEWEKINN